MKWSSKNTKNVNVLSVLTFEHFCQKCENCLYAAVLGLVHRASYCRLRGTRENNDGYKKE